MPLQEMASSFHRHPPLEGSLAPFDVWRQRDGVLPLLWSDQVSYPCELPGIADMHNPSSWLGLMSTPQRHLNDARARCAAAVDVLTRARSLPCSAATSAFAPLAQSASNFQLALDALLTTLDSQTQCESVQVETFAQERENALAAVRNGAITPNEPLVWVLWKILKGEGYDIGPYSPSALARIRTPLTLDDDATSDLCIYGLFINAHSARDDVTYPCEGVRMMPPPSHAAESSLKVEAKHSEGFAHAMGLLFAGRQRVLSIVEQRQLMPYLTALAASDVIVPSDIGPLVAHMYPRGRRLAFCSLFHSVPSIDIVSTYGALLIGVYFATFFQGILTVQAYIYYDSFPDDSRGMKALVAIVWLLDFIHLVLICQTEYHYLVTNWGNKQALLETTIPLDLHLILLTLASLTCQAFFLNRVWKFSKNLLLTVFLGAACLSTGIIDIVIAAQTVHGKSVETILSHIFQAEVIAVFTVGAAADMAIAMILVWYLKREMSSFERIKSLVTHLIQYAIATGLYVLSLDSLIFLAMHFSLGRMYTNALLATLNSRKSMRARLALPADLRWTGISGMPSAPQSAAQPEVIQDFAMKSVDGPEASRSTQGGFDSVKVRRFHSDV
ncbi:hypothetical protein FB451DRAFT_1417000 [Mycena latifolia]|nr:hypothetical protein FB451DRAFT_1417000 [Mycena latifolia]